MGGVRKRRFEEHAFTPLMHGESHRKGSTSNGLCRSPAQTSRNGRNDCRNAFLLRGCWDLISGYGREVRGAASVCLFAPN